MRLKLYAAPTAEAVGLDELKDNPAVRITVAADDTWVDQLIIAARKRYEELTQRILMSSTWDLYLDGFPGDNKIELPAPLISVTSITYYDTANALQTWAATNYVVDAVSEPVARVALAYGVSWPLTYARPNAVIVRFVAGYTAETIPADLKYWLCVWIGAVYDGNSALQDVAEMMMRTNGRWSI